MTQEEKDLLLKDLCARLPYGVKCKINRKGFENYPPTTLKAIYDSGTCYFEYGIAGKSGSLDYNEVQPYLRPMSNMTKGECSKFAILVGSVSYSLSLEKIINYKKADMSYFTSLSNWLNKHQFDYRGLIEKGLAIAVTPENDPYKFQ